MEQRTLKSRLENYWYYYKWHTLGGLFLALVLAVGITQCAGREKPDYSVVLYVNQTVSDNSALALQTVLESFAKDRNGDGRAMVQVINVSYDPNDRTQMGQAHAGRVLAQIATGESILYIVDDEAYAFYQKNSLFQRLDWLPDKDSTAWNWKGSAVQTQVFDRSSRYPQDLYFCIRKVSGTAVEKEKDIEDREKAAMELLNAVMEPIQ